jgi:hypothetical protein
METQQNQRSHEKAPPSGKAKVLDWPSVAAIESARHRAGAEPSRKIRRIGRGDTQMPALIPAGQDQSGVVA